MIRRPRGSYRNVDIAERLGRSKPSATKALSNLAETASAEACRMEHCLSEDSCRRFAAYLGSRRDEGDGG